MTGTNFSFASWVKFKSGGSNWERIFDFGNGAGDDNILLAREGTSNNIAFHVYDGHNQNQIAINAQNVITTNQWMHVGVTMSEDANGLVTAKLYINGAEQASTSGHYNIATMARDDNYIAKSHWSQDGVSNIQMAGITIADYGYTANEISNIKTATDNPNNQHAVKIAHDSGTDANPNLNGDDTLNGGAGDDTIYGNGGDDTITGGTGDDTITGGEGNDVIVFNNGDGKDIITDFDQGNDKIDLSSYTKADGSYISFNDLTISQSGDDVKITGLASGDEITIKNQLIAGIKESDFILTNNAPIARDDVFNFYEGSWNNSISFAELLANDSDADGDSLSVVAGSVKLVSGAGSFVIDQNAEEIRYLGGNEGEQMKFSYQVTDGTHTDTAQATVNFINKAPVANDDTIDIPNGNNPYTIQFIQLLSNDSDYYRDTLSVSHIELADSSHGTLSNIDYSAGTATFTPASGVSQAILNYKVSDGTDESNVAQVKLDVNHAPIANDDAFSFSKTGYHSISFSELLANDSDADGDSLSVVAGSIRLVSGGGSLTIDRNDEEIEYLHGREGDQIKFSYQVTDGTATDTAEATVNFINNAPVAHDDNIYISNSNAYMINLSTLLTNDRDADRDTLSVSYIELADSSHGTLTNIDYNAGTAIFTPINGVNEAILNYKISDGSNESNIAQVKIVTVNRMDMSYLDGHNGFRLDGINAWDYSGGSVSSAGDINGDGYDDIIIGATGVDADGNSNSGQSYVVFGKSGGFSPSMDLSSIDGSNGFRLNGIDSGDNAGFSVSSAGDINGDGYDDVVIGARYADPSGNSSAGESYIIFGKANGYSASIDLSSLNGTNGFRVNGIDANDYSGRSVSSAGDINGDGYDDIIIGASGADPSGNSSAGESYIIFGKANGYSASIDLSSLNGSNGFRLDGIDASDYLGSSVSSAGDINGDGFDDIIIGATGADANGKWSSGESYVVFGKANGYSASVELSSLNGSNGFRLDGNDWHGNAGSSVSSAGDINGDGFDDIIVGVQTGSPNNKYRSGESYVIFGKADGFSSSINLSPSSFDGTNGFQLFGTQRSGQAGGSVSSAGDFNGDGYDDVIVGAHYTDVRGNHSAGESYIIFGKASGFSSSVNLSTLTQSTGIILEGVSYGEWFGKSVSSAGDINGDGFDDVVVGASWSWSNGNRSAGKTYVVFGYDTNNSQSVTNNGTLGNDKITGGAADDILSGGAGDDIINGGNGNDKITGGSDDDKLNGGHGRDQFVFNNGDGKDIIIDFNHHQDFINLSAYTKSDGSKIAFNDLTLTQTAGDVKITGLDSGDEILIRNQFVANITSNNIITYYSHAPIAHNDSFNAYEGLWNSISFADLLNNDLDANNDNLSIVAGSINLISGASSLSIDQYRQEIRDVKGIEGEVIKFSYQVTDGTYTDTAQATVNFLNNAPIANDDNFIVLQDNTPYHINFRRDLSNANNMLRNDYDDSSDTLSVVHIELKDKSSGLLSNIDYDIGIATFTPAAGVKQATLIYTLSDGTDTDQAEVTLYKDISFNLSSLDGNNGFRLNGVDANDSSGWVVSSAGDINGDGFDDVIIGATGGDVGANTNAGQSYVVFGKAVGFSASINLSSLNGNNGFRLDGINSYDTAGAALSSAGDINGDGFGDIIIGAKNADRNGNNSGESYVVFGKASGYTASLDLSSLNGTNGFRVEGTNANDYSGASVSLAGDINNDGYDDIIIGSDYYGNRESYILFGKADGYSASIDLSSLDGSNGFALTGIRLGGYNKETSVSSAGDVNGDGYDDIIVGAAGAGEAYILFGKENGYSSSMNISSLNGSNGFRIKSDENWNSLGNSVSSAGDVNGDGYDDVIVGNTAAHIGRNIYEGKSHVVFGKASGFSSSINTSSLNGSNGFSLYGNWNDLSGGTVSSAGDFNGDGFDDILVNASGQLGGYAGQSYIMFGKKSGFETNVSLSSLYDSTGLRINGVDSDDWAGRSLSSAGDVNNDGYDDIIIGAYSADPSGRSSAGESYVVFGYDTDNAQSVTNTGTAGSDQITGGAANDILSGGDGDDMINGGNGDDKIKGGDGNDRLNGGHGNDEFIFDNGDDSDIILDFEDGKDKIDLSNYTKSDGSSISFNDLNITKSGGDVKITGLDSGDEMLIRNISDSNITADDFIF